MLLMTKKVGRISFSKVAYNIPIDAIQKNEPNGKSKE